MEYNPRNNEASKCLINKNIYYKQTNKQTNKLNELTFSSFEKLGPSKLVMVNSSWCV